jgi:hypothetical protein
MTKPTPPTNPPALVLYGLDANGKPCAASFSVDQADLPTKAADSLKLKVAMVETPDLVDLARELAPGQILTPGKGIVPPVRKELFDKLVAVVAVGRKVEAPSESPARPIGGMSAVAQAASEATKPKRLQPAGPRSISATWCWPRTGFPATAGMKP